MSAELRTAVLWFLARVARLPLNGDRHRSDLVANAKHLLECAAAERRAATFRAGRRG